MAISLVFFYKVSLRYVFFLRWLILIVYVVTIHTWLVARQLLNFKMQYYLLEVGVPLLEMLIF